MKTPDRFKRPSDFHISEKQHRSVSVMESETGIAIQLSTFIAQFAAIELSLPFLFSSITKLDDSACRHILGVNTDFSRRLDMLDKAARTIPTDDKECRFFDSLISEVKYLVKRRNIYCHAMFSKTDKEGELSMHLYFHDGNRGHAEEIITEDILRKDCIRAERVNLATHQHLQGLKSELRPLRDIGRPPAPQGQKA
ncbi:MULTISPECIES: hypothetical protein [unclassified Hyphomonas]|uniref:hypothetical protein n=1 Tax=unclassified Hyphomonas TaxID=2630699 RepID=UPI000C3AA213|nr:MULTISPECIES: hypothetical protein [unclassified Hyphomonas]MAN89810.1 hypothetical protein [Hyphomonadaceae bacterium]|tara:strand:+ start:75 stop:662 length:588 start_codon:yes stop_codon:yes gene_type:complete